MSLAAARAGIVAQVEALGLRVTDDARTVNPPCVLVELPENVTRLTGCAYRASLPVVILAPPPGDAAAVDWLLDTLEQLLDVLNVDQADPTRRDIGGQTLPGYRLSVLITT